MKIILTGTPEELNNFLLRVPDNDDSRKPAESDGELLERLYAESSKCRPVFIDTGKSLVEQLERLNL